VILSNLNLSNDELAMILLWSYEMRESSRTIILLYNKPRALIYADLYIIILYGRPYRGRYTTVVRSVCITCISLYAVKYGLWCEYIHNSQHSYGASVCS